MGQKYEICQIALLHPLFKISENYGINSEKLIKKSTLRHFDIHYINNYVPLEVVYDYYLKLKNNLPDIFFKTNYLEYFELSNLGNFGEYLAKLPTLYSVLHQFVIYKSIFQTNLNCNLSIYDDTVKFSFSCSYEPTASRKMSETIFMAIILQLFKTYTPENWIPNEIHIPYTTHSEIKTILPKNCKITLNQATFAVVFPREILQKATKISMHFSNHVNPTVPDKSISNIIKEILQSYKSEYIPSLSNLAQHFNISESSIKRSLKSENTKFSKILENILYKKAVLLLTNSDLNITLISEFLGYSDSPNFIRSFKKWSGITPGQYRDKYKMTCNDNKNILEMA